MKKDDAIVFCVNTNNLKKSLKATDIVMLREKEAKKRWVE
jgi:hypothetical protein